MGAECIAAGKNTISPSFFLSRAECVFFFITLFYFIFIHNMLVQTLSFAKAHRCPPRPSPLRKTGGTSSPFSRGEEPRGGLLIPESGAGSDGKGRR